MGKGSSIYVSLREGTSLFKEMIQSLILHTAITKVAKQGNFYLFLSVLSFFAAYLMKNGLIFNDISRSNHTISELHFHDEEGAYLEN